MQCWFFFFFFFVASSLPFLALTQEPCTVCADGENVTLPDQALVLPDPYSFIQTCGQLQSLLGTAAQQGDDICNGIQSVGTYCGCPIPDNSCSLCGEGNSVTNRDLVVNFTLPFDVVPSTCAMVEAYLYSQNSSSDACKEGSSFQNECGCTGSATAPTGSPPTSASNNQTTDQCSLCWDGSAATKPNYDLSNFLPPDIDTGGVVPTCGLVEGYVAAQFKADSAECDQVHLISGLCGCPPVPNACEFCPGEELPNPDYVVQSFQQYDIPPSSCQDTKNFLEQYDDGDHLCKLAKTVNYLCGCNGGSFDYFGADTTTKKIAMAWVPRVSGIISSLSSIYILQDILRGGWSKMNVYQELVSCMALYDISGSVSFAFSSLPIPKVNEYGEPTAIWGARGNAATCTAQGFFVQLGYTGIFYNLTLSLYYVLVIKYSWREERLRKYSKAFHIPALAGFALAFAGIPFYENDIWGCFIAPPPMAESRRNIAIFALTPISLVIFVVSVNMLVVYLAVRKQDMAAGRWRMSSQPSSSVGERRVATPNRRLERAVFWQCVFYLGAFYITWPFLLMANIISDVKPQAYGFYITALFLAPLQGFWNFLVYTRPRFQRYLEQRRKRREEERRRQQAAEATGSNPGAVMAKTTTTATASTGNTQSINSNSVAMQDGTAHHGETSFQDDGAFHEGGTSFHEDTNQDGEIRHQNDDMIEDGATRLDGEVLPAHGFRMDDETKENDEVGGGDHEDTEMPQEEVFDDSFGSDGAEGALKDAHAE